MVAPSLRISQCRQHMKGPKDQVDIQCIALPIHQYPITAGLSATAGLPRLCARVFAVVLIVFGGALGLLGLLGGGWQLVVKRRRRLYFEVRPGSCFGASSSIWWRHVVPSSEKIDAERVYNIAKSRLVLGCIVMNLFHPGPEVARIESWGFFASRRLPPPCFLKSAASRSLTGIICGSEKNLVSPQIRESGSPS